MPVAFKSDQVAEPHVNMYTNPPSLGLLAIPLPVSIKQLEKLAAQTFIYYIRHRTDHAQSVQADSGQ